MSAAPPAVSAPGAHRRPPEDPAPALARRLRWWDEWPLLLVLATAAAGLAVVASDHFKRGTVLFAVALLLGTVLRAVLPTHRAGLLKVRGRTVDVLTLAVLAVGTLTLAVVVPPPT